MARNQYEKPGDVEFESLNAVKGGSAFNMLGVVDTISLYEDIERMFMTGSLTFTDANNILRFYDFRDDVYIVGSFRTPLPTGVKNNVGGVFPSDVVNTRSVFVMKVIDVSRTKMPKQQGDFVELKLISASAFVNSNKKISRSISGVGIAPIFDLMEEHFYDRKNPDRVGLPDFLDDSLYQDTSNRSLDLFDSRYSLLQQKIGTETATPVKYAFPFQSPASMVQSVLNDLISTSNDFGYKMHETLTGFKLSSMQGLNTGQPVIGYVKKYTDARFEQTIDQRMAAMFSIETMDFATIGNRLNQMEAGGFRSKMYEFDITTKQLQRRLFDYASQNPYLESGDRYPVNIPSSQQDEFGGFGNIESFDVSSFSYNNAQGEPDPNLYIDDEGHLNMNSQKVMMYDTQLNITVPGNHIVEAGMRVNVSVPPNTSQSESDVDEDISGSYLVAALSHNFEFSGNTHRMSLALTRNYRTTPKTVVRYNTSTEVT